jgi:hypothetical protein
MVSSNVPRRGVLAGGVAAAVALTAGLAGCRDTPKAQPPSPILPVREDSLALLAAYDATLRRHPDLADRLKPLREDHHRHVRELDRELGSATPSASGSATVSPSVSPVPSSADAALGALTGQEKQAEQRARRSCLAAPDRYATLFGSIAACRASHVEALR